MEFGKVLDEEVKNVNFSLPPDGIQTAVTLKGTKSGPPAEFYIGCAKWGRKEWLGMIYPPKTKEVNFLDEYAKHFNSIEMNAIFYSMPKPDMVKKWKQKAADHMKTGFLFCPKFPQIISHLKRLRNAEEATDSYISGISEFGELLGPCFLQMGDNFGPDNFEILEQYLKSLPIDFKVFVELRHPKWFSDPVIRKNLFQMLAALGKGTVITDASGRRDCVHMELTIPEIFIRFVGNGKAHQDSDFSRIDEWVTRIRPWLDNGLEKIYFFLHQHDEKDTPILANYTIQQFNKHLGSVVPEIKFITNQGELF